MSKELKLHVSNTETQSSVIPIHWCLSKELIDELKERGEKVNLLIVTTPERNWTGNYNNEKLESRKIVPLTDLMAYVDFKCSGENAIFAAIMYDYGTTGFLSKDSKGYMMSVFEHPIECYNLCSSPDDLQGPVPTYLVKHTRDTIKVNVPDGVFAASPAEWEKTWVNHWFNYWNQGNAHDQCDFRKRRILAYTIQPIWALLYTLFRFAFAAIWFSAGFKIGNLRAAVDVIRYSFLDVTSESGDHRNQRWLVIPKVKSGWKHLANVVNPLFLGSLIALSVKTGVSVFSMFSTLLYVAGVGFMIIGLFAYVVYKAKNIEIIAKLIDIRDEWNYRNEQRRIEEMEQGLLCNGEHYYKVSDLPKQSRSIKLRFQGIKASVCRPFSG